VNGPSVPGPLSPVAYRKRGQENRRVGAAWAGASSRSPEKPAIRRALCSSISRMTQLLGATNRAVLATGTCVLALATLVSASEPSPAGVFDVRAFGATGNGATLDTRSIQQAVRCLRRRGGGQVRLPPGRYLSGTVHCGAR